MFRVAFIFILSVFVLISSCKKDDDESNTPADPDNKNPVVYLNLENNNGQIVQFDTLHLFAQANDSDGVISKVKFFEGESLIAEDDEVPFRCSWIAAEPGDYLFSAVAYDDDGGWTQSNTRSLDVLSGTMPHVAIQEPNNGSYLKEGSSVAIITNAWDYDGEIVKVEVYFNDVLINTHLNVTTTLDSIHNIELGEFRVKAIAYDDDGHASAPDEAILEVTPNNPPIVEISTYYSLEDLWAGETIRLDVEVSDWDGSVVKIELYASGTLVAVDSTSSYFHDIYWSNIDAGTFDLQVLAYDNSGGRGYSNIINVEINQRLEVNGSVVCFEWGGSPDIAFALVHETNELLMINPEIPEIISTYTLPHSHPLRMKYSEEDDKIYIVSYYTGAVSVFNVASGSFTDFSFSPTADGRDIGIVPERRRIYVAASDGMYIMDMDGGAVLAENHSYECESIAVMHKQEKVFVNFNTYSDMLQRFSVAGDEFTSEEQNDEGSYNCAKMLMPSDDSKLVYPCMGYNTQITALEPLNLQNVLGVYTGSSVRDFCISKDSEYFYMVGWDGIAIFNAQSYVKLEESKFGIPNVDDFETTIGLNSDGNVVMIFTCDDYYEEDYYIYFLEKDW